MAKTKLFTQITKVPEETHKRFEEIAFYLFIKQLNQMENADIILEGISIAAHCKNGSILHATELLNNTHYIPTHLEIATFISFYNIPIRYIRNFDLSERTYYRLLPEFIYSSEEKQKELVKNKFSEDLLQEVVKFNKILYNLTTPFRVYEFMKEN